MRGFVGSWRKEPLAVLPLEIDSSVGSTHARTHARTHIYAHKLLVTS